MREAGIDNVNIDLIFGFPGHTLENWKYTLERTIAMSPSHLSFYSLQIEENTPMYEAFRAGTAIQIPQELDRKMYSFVLEILKASGYRHYEISNAAFPGFECRHNLKYWSMKDYIGVGAAAHSFIGGCRFENPGSISDYTALINKNKSQYGSVLYGNLHYMQRQSVEELISDCIFTQLRTVEGIDLIQFRQKYGIDLSEYKRDVIAKYIADGCLNFDEGRIHLTNKGIDISNLIISELM